MSLSEEEGAHEARRHELAWEATAFLHADLRGEFVCGAILLGGQVSLVSWDAEEFVDALASVDGLCLWFGAARFEFGWLWDRLMERKVRPERTSRDRGTTTLHLRVEKAHHRDAASMWLTPLDTFSPAPPPPLGLPCVCEQDCGGYCSITAAMPPRHRKLVAAHVVATCEAIWTGLERLREAQKALDLDGRNSIGSTAWASARRRFALPDVEPSRSARDYNHLAALAARTEVLRPRVDRANDYDLSMAYNGALARIELPLGVATRLWGRSAQQAFSRGAQGAYCVDIYSPPAFLPALPWRSPGGRVSFPTGTLRGTWTRDELRYALECGYRIDRFHSGQIYETTAPLLRDWAEVMWQARVAYEEEGSDLAGYVKSLAVALPGVFGLDPWAEQTLWGQDLASQKRCPCQKLGRDGECPCRGLCCHGCRGYCGEPIPVSRDRDLWVRLFYRAPGRSHVLWNALVLAWCRVEVHRCATQGGDGSDLVSINTDGLRCLRGRIVSEIRGHGRWRDKGWVVEAFPGTGVVTRAGNTSAARNEETGELVVRSSGRARTHRGRILLTDEQIAKRIVGPRAFEMVRKADNPTWLPLPQRDGFNPRGGAGADRLHLENILAARGIHWIGQRIMEQGSQVTRAPTEEECIERDEWMMRRAS